MVGGWTKVKCSMHLQSSISQKWKQTNFKCYILLQSFVFPQWIRGGGRGGGPRLSPPECLSDPLLGRHLYVKIRVSSMWIQWIHFFVLSEEWIGKCLSDPKAKLRMDHEDLNPPWCQFGWKVWLKKRIIFREQNITMWKMGLGGRSLFCCYTTSLTSGTDGEARCGMVFYGML